MTLQLEELAVEVNTLLLIWPYRFCSPIRISASRVNFYQKYQLYQIRETKTPTGSSLFLAFLLPYARFSILLHKSLLKTFPSKSFLNPRRLTSQY